MKHSYKLLMAGVVLLAISGIAHAETGKMYIPPVKSAAEYNAHDVVRSSNGNPVRSSSGNCVRTQWVAGCDACGEAPTLPEVRIPLAERTVYFDLNKSKLTPAATKKLDALVDTIKMHGRVKSVRIAGFADRLGSPVRNEKLSKQRADRVRKYLMSKGIISPMVVETRWFGDTLPATNCPKDMKRPALVVCLQRDRRVEIEVEFAAPGEVITLPATEAPKKHKHKHKKARHHAPKATKEQKAKAK